MVATINHSTDIAKMIIEVEIIRAAFNIATFNQNPFQRTILVDYVPNIVTIGTALHYLKFSSISGISVFMRYTVNGQQLRQI